MKHYVRHTKHVLGKGIRNLEDGGHVYAKALVVSWDFCDCKTPRLHHHWRWYPPTEPSPASEGQ